jgi:ParB/RepB/Spo0J family partition protein
MNKTTTAKKAEKPNAAALAKSKNQELVNSPTLQFISLKLIETAEQIRKEFNQESIEELANDIKARGMLQPVLLRPIEGGKFLMIAGERRLRAARFAELENIPALIGEVEEQTAMMMQLAENIHREDLSLEEESEAVKKLYEILGSLEKVANTVKKSKSWCSKRYAIAQKGLHYKASSLLEDGITEDIELLKSYSEYCNKPHNYFEMCKWDKKIRNGEAGRKEIRAALKEVKERKKEEAAKEAAEDKEKGKKVSHAKPKAPPPTPPWTIEAAMGKLGNCLYYTDTDMSGIDLIESYTMDQRSEVIGRLIKAAKEGASKEGFKKITRLVTEGLYDDNLEDVDFLAIIAGYSGKPFNWMTFLEDIQTPREKD